MFLGDKCPFNGFERDYLGLVNFSLAKAQSRKEFLNFENREYFDSRFLHFKILILISDNSCKQVLALFVCHVFADKSFCRENYSISLSLTGRFSFSDLLAAMAISMGLRPSSAVTGVGLLFSTASTKSRISAMNESM